MKKLIAVIAIILIIGGFVAFQKLQPQNGESGTSPATKTYKDGIYTGIVGSASQYGDVQVRVTISGGKITKIDVIKMPNLGGGHTFEVNDSSFPILKQEAIAAQSAEIDNVTGATQTTEGFVQSLQSALDKAVI